METIYDLSVKELQPISSFKEKNYQWIKVGTPDKKFVLSYSSEYAGDGLHEKVKLLWYGIFPFFLTNEQKQVLIEIAKNIHFSSR